MLAVQLKAALRRGETFAKKYFVQDFNKEMLLIEDAGNRR